MVLIWVINTLNKFNIFLGDINDGDNQGDILDDDTIEFTIFFDFKVSNAVSDTASTMAITATYYEGATLKTNTQNVDFTISADEITLPPLPPVLDISIEPGN